MTTRHIGGSILPSSDPRILTALQCARGTLQVRALPDEDTHVLFLDDRVVAEHPNGYSCRALAERIRDCWAGKCDAARVLEQFDHILRCGGSGVRAEVVELVKTNPQEAA